MRHRWKILTVPVVVFLALLVSSNPSGAERVCSTTVNSFGQSIVTCTDVESDPGSGRSGPQGPVDDQYHWRQAGCHTFAGPYRAGATVTFTQIGPPTDEPDLYVDARSGTPVDWTTYNGATPSSVPGAMRYMIACDTGAGVYARFTNLPPNATAVVDPRSLRTTALASLSVPTTTPGSNPSLSDPNRQGVTLVPVWLWIESPWQTQSAEETQGSVTVRVDATPVRTIWTMGDGTTFDCQQGTVWSPGMPDSASTCQHTYFESSASQPANSFMIGSTVEWEYSWSVNGVDQGVFGAFEALTSVPYQVGEIQTVNG